MYAETGLMYPYFQNFSQELQQFDEFDFSQKSNAQLVSPHSFIETSTISDYNLGGEGDLFNAPEPVIQEPLMSLDPMTAAISIISCGDQSLTVSDIESSIENGQILSEVFYECRKELLEKQGNEIPLTEIFSIQTPAVNTNENWISNEKLFSEAPFSKSASSGCLRSMESSNDSPLRPNFLDFPVMDFGTIYGMRRAFSEGDMKTLGNDNKNLVQSNNPPMQQPVFTSSCASEDRREKLSRYWSKKSKRNFSRKIKYACRKALADSQPRIRGRFARTE